MRILDSHFHYLPREIFEALCERTVYPLVERDGKGGYRYYRRPNAPPTNKPWREWFDLDEQLQRMDATGHQVDVISSIGPHSVHFSELPAEEGREAALIWNEAQAKAQREHPGRMWGTAAIPLVDTQIAIDVLDDAVNRLASSARICPAASAAIRASTRSASSRFMRALPRSASRSSCTRPTRFFPICCRATTARSTSRWAASWN